MFLPTCLSLRNHNAKKKVYGLVWPHFGPGRYGVYKRWENTPDQRREMLEYDRIDGFNQCRGEEPFIDQAWILGLSFFGLSMLLVVAVRLKICRRKRLKICRRKWLDSTQRSELELQNSPGTYCNGRAVDAGRGLPRRDPSIRRHTSHL